MDPDAFLQERIAEKADSVAAVEKAMATIDKQQREPDEWERYHLAHAFVMIFNGIYRAAPVDVEFAMLPPAQRIAAVKIPSVFGSCRLEVLREALRVVKTEPVRPFPHIGPVRLLNEER